jgi:hypothetical protein
VVHDALSCANIAATVLLVLDLAEHERVPSRVLDRTADMPARSVVENDEAVVKRPRGANR